MFSVISHDLQLTNRNIFIADGCGKTIEETVPYHFESMSSVLPFVAQLLFFLFSICN